MNYRHLGKSGIQVSELSLGSWVSFHTQFGVEEAAAMMAAAYDAGANFFDNAENYAAGESERIMGAALKKLGWRRGSYLVSTKFFWGLHDNPNEKNTLNRKYLIEAMNGSLDRLDMEYVDIVQRALARLVDLLGEKPLVGVVHLAPLPGAPRWELSSARSKT